MSLESIVNVTISSASRGVDRKGFGIPLVVGRHDYNTDLARVYDTGTLLVDLVADGFSPFDPIYLAAAGLARNTPKPPKVVVGRLTTPYTQAFALQFFPADATASTLYSFTLVSPAGVATVISYTAAAAETGVVVAQAVQALVAAVSGLTVPATVDDSIEVAVDADDSTWRVKGMDFTRVLFLEATPDSSLAADMAAIQEANNSWYGLIHADPASEARITALAQYIETQEKIYISRTHDNGATVAQ